MHLHAYCMAAPLMSLGGSDPVYLNALAEEIDTSAMNEVKTHWHELEKWTHGISTQPASWDAMRGVLVNRHPEPPDGLLRAEIEPA